MHPVVVLAMQWWVSSGPRTREHLGSLIEHFANEYAVPHEERAALLEEAWKQLPAWQKATH
jgi:hypothetical protein